MTVKMPKLKLLTNFKHNVTHSVAMSFLSKFAFVLAFIAFASGPSVMASNVAHCEDFGDHSAISQTADQQAKSSVAQSSDGLIRELPQKDSDGPQPKHTHCNPVACYFTAPAAVLVSQGKYIETLVSRVVPHPVSIHLKSFPRPPSC